MTAAAARGLQPSRISLSLSLSLSPEYRAATEREEDRTKKEKGEAKKKTKKTERGNKKKPSELSERLEEVKQDWKGAYYKSRRPKWGIIIRLVTYLWQWPEGKMYKFIWRPYFQE